MLLGAEYSKSEDSTYRIGSETVIGSFVEKQPMEGRNSLALGRPFSRQKLRRPALLRHQRNQASVQCGHRCRMLHVDAGWRLFPLSPHQVMSIRLWRSLKTFLTIGYVFCAYRSSSDAAIKNLNKIDQDCAAWYDKTRGRALTSTNENTIERLRRQGVKELDKTE